MPSGKVEYFTADGQSTIKILRSLIFTSTTADTLDLKAGSSGGTIFASFAVAAGGSATFDFAQGLPCPSGAIYADVTTTGAPKITLVGD